MSRMLCTNTRRLSTASVSCVMMLCLQRMRRGSRARYGPYWSGQRSKVMVEAANDAGLFSDEDCDSSR